MLPLDASQIYCTLRLKYPAYPSIVIVRSENICFQFKQPLQRLQSTGLMWNTDEKNSLSDSVTDLVVNYGKD